jgi:glutamyl-tRNA synthetase
VRFAPSPTGPLYYGVRTAFIQLFAKKKNNGVFFLRIEDTDQNRLFQVPKNISWKLEWLGIAPDETIGKMKIWSYRQSERKDLYQQYAAD